MKKVLLLLLFSTFLLAQSIPPVQWIHPKPFGTSLGWIKVWDANSFYAFGSAGAFVNSTNAGQTFNNQPIAGFPLTAAPALGNDVYAAYFWDRTNGIVGGGLGLMRTTDGGQSFTSVGGGPSTGTVRSINFLNNNLGLLCGTSAIKAFFTTDGGTSWSQLAALPSATFYAALPLTPTRWIVGSTTSSSANVRVTTDAGSTWNAVAAGSSTIYSFAFADTLTGYAGAGSGGGFKTTDGGLSWTALPLGAPTSSVFYTVKYDAGKIYFCDDDSTIFVSNDAGATFSTIRYKTAENIPQIMRGFDVKGNLMYVTGDNGAFTKSTDGGATWTSPTKISRSGFIQTLFATPTGKIIAGGTPSGSGRQVIYSNNFGATWNTTDLSVSTADLRGGYYFDDNLAFLVGSGGSVWKTTDGGASFEKYAGTTTIQAFSSIHFADAQNGFITGNGGSVYKTTDGGTTWVSNPISGVTLGISSVYMTSASTVYAISSTSVYKTTDGGATWATITPGVPIGPISTIKFRNSQVGYLVGASATSGQGYVFKTTDAGATWSSRNFPYTTNMLYNIEFRNDSDYVVTGMSGGVFHTANDGLSWKQLNLGLNNALNSQVLATKFVSEDTLVLSASSGGHILKVLFDPIVPVELISFVANTEGNSVQLTWSTATETNNIGFTIERCLEGADQWKSIGTIAGAGTTTEPKQYSFTDIGLSPGAYLYRLKQLDADGTIAYHNLPGLVQVGNPAEFSLGQNYPNPFNPSTTINYTLPVRGHVSLKVFDILGSEVATMVDGLQETGTYAIVFDAASLTSGVYYYRLTSGSYSETRKMVVMK